VEPVDQQLGRSRVDDAQGPAVQVEQRDRKLAESNEQVVRRELAHAEDPVDDVEVVRRTQLQRRDVDVDLQVGAAVLTPVCELRTARGEHEVPSAPMGPDDPATAILAGGFAGASDGGSSSRMRASIATVR
jgi:hypothetical protein